MSYVLNFVAHFPVLVFGTSVWERHLLTEWDTSKSQKCRQESGLIKEGRQVLK